MVAWEAGVFAENNARIEEEFPCHTKVVAIFSRKIECNESIYGRQNSERYSQLEWLMR